MCTYEYARVYVCMCISNYLPAICNSRNYFALLLLANITQIRKNCLVFLRASCDTLDSHNDVTCGISFNYERKLILGNLMPHTCMQRYPTIMNYFLLYSWFSYKHSCKCVYTSTRKLYYVGRRQVVNFEILNFV